MKNLRYLLLGALATPALAQDPATLKQYEQLRQGYYEFDPHAYRSFTCQIDVSSLDATVANIKQMLAPRADTLKVKDELASYSLTVDSKIGLSINNPTLDIQVLSDKGMADPAKVRQGIEETKQGFDRQVQGTDQVISGIFNGYLDTVPELSSVTHTDGGWIVKYSEGGVSATDTIQGSKIHEEAGTNGLSIVSDMEFAKVNADKLGIKTSTIHMTQGAQTAVTGITVSYQTLGSLQVPAAIVTKTTITTAGVAQTTADSTIKFQACAIKT